MDTCGHWMTGGFHCGRQDVFNIHICKFWNQAKSSACNHFCKPSDSLKNPSFTKTTGSWSWIVVHPWVFPNVSSLLTRYAVYIYSWTQGLRFPANYRHRWGLLSMSLKRSSAFKTNLITFPANTRINTHITLQPYNSSLFSPGSLIINMLLFCNLRRSLG